MRIPSTPNWNGPGKIIQTSPATIARAYSFHSRTHNPPLTLLYTCTVYIQLQNNRGPRHKSARNNNVGSASSALAACGIPLYLSAQLPCSRSLSPYITRAGHKEAIESRGRRPTPPLYTLIYFARIATVYMTGQERKRGRSTWRIAFRARIRRRLHSKFMHRHDSCSPRRGLSREDSRVAELMDAEIHAGVARARVGARWRLEREFIWRRRKMNVEVMNYLKCFVNILY